MGNLELLLGLVRSSLSFSQKRTLLKKLDNLKSLTVLSIEDIQELTGFTPKRRDWRPEDILDRVERDQILLDRYAIGAVSYLSAYFPPLLREISDPPFALFFRGKLPDPEKAIIGIVGTRRPSGEGALAAARLGSEFATAGIPVVSGLARGIDAYAHRGNVDAGAPSIAILACGPERIYPLSNVRLAGAILEHGGCILSEYPPGEGPLKYRFPQRNRLISGLSRSVIVVEAPERSGALITAEFALEQGRDVYVYRDTLGSRRGQGTRALNAQGAEAVSSAFEVLSAWTCSVHYGTENGRRIGKSAQLDLDLRDSAEAGKASGQEI